MRYYEAYIGKGIVALLLCSVTAVAAPFHSESKGPLPWLPSFEVSGGDLSIRSDRAQVEFKGVSTTLDDIGFLILTCSEGTLIASFFWNQIVDREKSTFKQKMKGWIRISNEDVGGQIEIALDRPCAVRLHGVAEKVADVDRLLNGMKKELDRTGTLTVTASDDSTTIPTWEQGHQISVFQFKRLPRGSNAAAERLDTFQSACKRLIGK